MVYNTCYISNSTLHCKWIKEAHTDAYHPSAPRWSCLMERRARGRKTLILEYIGPLVHSSPTLNILQCRLAGWSFKHKIFSFIYWYHYWEGFYINVWCIHVFQCNMMPRTLEFRILFCWWHLKWSGNKVITFQILSDRESNTGKGCTRNKRHTLWKNPSNI